MRLGLRGGRSSPTAWAVADQAVSSGTNFVLTLVVIREVSSAAFGAFAIGTSIYLLCLGLSRSVVSETLLVSRGRQGPPDGADVASATAALLWLSLAASCLIGVSALLVGSPSLRLTMLALAASLPGLLLQDHKRILFFAAGHPQRAFVSDATWAVLQLAGVAVALLIWNPPPAVLILVWGASASAGALLWPSATTGWWRAPAVSWFRRHGRTAAALMGDSALFQFGNQAAVFSLGLLAGLAEVGAFRAAQTLFGPIIVLMLGMRTVGLPSLMAAARHDLDTALRAAGRATLIVAALSAMWGAAVLLIPDPLGKQVLGATWFLAAPLLTFIAIEKASSAIAWGGALRLRILLAPGTSLKVRTAATAIGLAAAVAGAYAAGALGMAIAGAVTAPVLAVVWVIAARRVHQRGVTSVSAVDENAMAEAMSPDRD